jgi:hypothetical protein
MRLRSLTSQACLLLASSLLLIGVSTARADMLVPAGLNPGDQFRLIFVSSETHDALSSDISVYDSFVNGVADAAGLGTYAGQRVFWHDLGSTDTNNAIDGLPDSNIPIFNMTGKKISDGNFWFGPIQAFSLSFDEFGQPTSSFAWTGTNTGGTGFVGRGDTHETLGSSPAIVSDPSAGITQLRWETFDDIPTDMHSLIGYSDVITVASTVPEPTTSTIFIGACVVLLVFKRLGLR